MEWTQVSGHNTISSPSVGTILFAPLDHRHGNVLLRSSFLELLKRLALLRSLPCLALSGQLSAIEIEVSPPQLLNEGNRSRKPGRACCCPMFF